MTEQERQALADKMEVTIRRNWQALSDAIKAFPGLAADAIDRWVLRQHAPYDIYDDGSTAICKHCDVAWPCDTFVEVSDRLRAREGQ